MVMVSTPTLLCPPPSRPISLQNHLSQLPLRVASQSLKPSINCSCIRISNTIFQNKEKPMKLTAAAALLGAGSFAISLVVGPASAADMVSSSLQLLNNEPSNALSLPTWAIHVSSVVEWITVMALVWHYGEKSGNESWKGLSWGMVPLLGGAFCACTWHFFYNSEALQVLVALQAALTVIGNTTMCFAAFRIYQSSEGSSKKL